MRTGLVAMQRRRRDEAFRPQDLPNPLHRITRPLPFPCRVPLPPRRRSRAVRQAGTRSPLGAAGPPCAAPRDAPSRPPSPPLRHPPTPRRIGDGARRGRARGSRDIPDQVVVERLPSLEPHHLNAAHSALPWGLRRRASACSSVGHGQNHPHREARRTFRTLSRPLPATAHLRRPGVRAHPGIDSGPSIRSRS